MAQSVYIVETNLGCSKADLERSIKDSLDAAAARITHNPHHATIVVSTLRSEQRLCRALQVTPDFFHSASPPHFVPLEYILQSIQQGFLSDERKWAFIPSAGLHGKRDSSNLDSSADASAVIATAGPPAKRTKHDTTGELSLEQLQERWKPHKLACFMWCPLVCVNQDLVDELEVVKLGRLIRDGDGIRALAYAHALSSIKSYPWRITAQTDLSTIPNLGGSGSIQSRIKDFLQRGRIQDADDYRKDAKYAEMQKIAKLPGYGPVKAAEAVHSGLTLDSFSQFDKRYYEDFARPIPRPEVEEIADLVAGFIDRVQPGCEYCVLGGYRRGKPQSNDIDILITHPEPGKERHLLERLITKLEKHNIIVERLNTAYPMSRADSQQKMMHSSLFDRLDKTFCVFMPPRKGSLQQIYRRVDLIVAPMHYYHTAIVGWTGSTQFERDLRRQAHKKSYKFDSSGLTHKVTSEDIPVHSEQHLFELLEIPYIPPEYRNAL